MTSKLTAKLSEIGRTTTTTQGYKDDDGRIILTASDTVIALTPAERRELVREALQAWHAWEATTRFEFWKLTEDERKHQYSFEAFCEEQGL